MDSIAKKIHDLLTARGLTLATAESCTSGRIAATLTSVSGASDYFQGGLVAYQDRLKVEMLGVAQSDIDHHDVVSRQVVEAMVAGACRLFHTHYAIASTGYAGTGAHGIPDGTIWLGWGTADAPRSVCLTGDQGREANTARATQQALLHFLHFLEEELR